MAPPSSLERQSRAALAVRSAIRHRASVIWVVAPAVLPCELRSRCDIRHGVDRLFIDYVINRDDFAQLARKSLRPGPADVPRVAHKSMKIF